MLWNVPVTIATKANPEAVKFVLEKESDTVTVEGVGPDDYILVSVDPLALAKHLTSPRLSSPASMVRF